MIPKCRIYCYETQEMIVANDYEELSEMFMALNTDSSIFSEPMQSTGLLDVHGNEIFEYRELDGAYEVIFKDLRYSLRHIQNNDIIDLYDYWRGKNGETEVTREYTKV